MELDQDTLQTAHDIEAAGLERKPAEAISRAIHEHRRPLATKADLEQLGKATKADVEQLGKATKADVEQLGKATKADVEQLRRETGERFDRVDQDIGRLEKSVERLDARLETRFNQTIMTIIGFGSAFILTLIAAVVTLLMNMNT